MCIENDRETKPVPYFACGIKHMLVHDFAMLGVIIFLHMQWHAYEIKILSDMSFLIARVCKYI